MTDLDLFEYVDYRAWLRDWLAASAGRPSLRAFARRAACSPALVSSIATGQRDLNTGRAEVFARAMKLDAEQTSHFVALVALAHEPSRERRERARDEVLTTKRFHGARRLRDARISVLSDPEVCAVFELARCAGWRDDPESIARSLQPASTIAAAAAALEVLKTAGMLVPDATGTLTPTEPEWATDHDVDIKLAADQLHRRLLARAPDVLETVPYEERQFGALTFAIPASVVPEIKARVARFHEEIMHLAEASEATRDRVYQLNVQLYPVARPVDG